jgi:hypothetical protein
MSDQSLGRRVLSYAGKLWAAPTTAVGLVLGGLGWALGGDAPALGNNALEFRGNLLIRRFTPAITIGNVICYARRDPGQDTQDHERQHTYQAELLGAAYLPAHVLFQLVAYGYSFCDRSGCYACANDRVHAAANLLETGPMSDPPRPWAMTAVKARG